MAAAHYHLQLEPLTVKSPKNCVVDVVYLDLSLEIEGEKKPVYDKLVPLHSVVKFLMTAVLVAHLI